MGAGAAQAGEALATGAMKVLSDKRFWIGVAILIALLLAKKYWNKLAGSFQADYGDYDDGALQEARKNELEGLANELYTAMHDISFGSALDDDHLLQLDQLTDRELKYVARFYKRAITRGVSLYQDINNEWMPFTDLDEMIMARLAQIGQKS